MLPPGIIEMTGWQNSILTELPGRDVSGAAVWYICILFSVAIFLCFGLISTKIRFLHDGIAIKYNATEQKYATVETPGVRGSTPIERLKYGCDIPGVCGKVQL
jgi:hypothetical protein